MANRILESVEAVQRKAKSGTCGEHEVGYAGGAIVQVIALVQGKLFAEAQGGAARAPYVAWFRQPGG
jgi:hypothetical protein